MRRKQNTTNEPVSTAEFEQAYAKGFPITVRFLRSLGIEEARAEEMAQAAWARGWEKRASLEQQERLIPWINTIALNLFRGWFRRSKRDDELPMHLESAALNTNDRLDIEKGLQACGPRERTLLTERYMEGYSSLEMAARHGMNATTVRVQLMRAKKKIRKLLEGGGRRTRPAMASA